MANVITGAKAFIKIDGAYLAFASGASVDQSNELEEIPQLDSLEVAEYAENGHRCSITIQSFKLSQGANFSGQPISNNASDYSLDFNNDVKPILLQPELIIEIVEDLPDGEKTTYVGYGAKFAGGNGQIDARGVWHGSWTFKCRRGYGI